MSLSETSGLSTLTAESAGSQPGDEGVMVVVDVQGSRREKYLTVVKQVISIKDGKLVLVGPKREDRVETFEWVG